MALKPHIFRWLGKYESFLWIITPIPSRRENNAANITAMFQVVCIDYLTLIYNNPYLELEIKSPPSIFS